MSFAARSSKRRCVGDCCWAKGTLKLALFSCCQGHIGMSMVVCMPRSHAQKQPAPPRNKTHLSTLPWPHLQHYSRVFNVEIEPHYTILNAFLIFLLVLHAYWYAWVAREGILELGPVWLGRICLYALIRYLQPFASPFARRSYLIVQIIVRKLTQGALDDVREVEEESKKGGPAFHTRHAEEERKKLLDKTLAGNVEGNLSVASVPGSI